MLEDIIKRLKRNKRGVSNVIVVMLSLILIVVIVANVVLWSYQMNQLDWEKMQEDISVIDVKPSGGTWSYNSSGYTLGGSTGWLSGNISDLTSDNGVYMTFGSYYSGRDTSDFVDNNTSDVDDFGDKGSHSNFSAQQAGPDGVCDTLTEENAEGSEDETNSPSSYANKDSQWIEDETSNSAYSSDDGYAGKTSTNDRGCDYLNFGFSIPPDTTISGIEVSMEGHHEGGWWGPFKFSARLIKNGAEVGDEKTVANDYGSSDSTQTVGGSSDLWGTTWSPSNINANNFGVRIQTDTAWLFAGAMYLDHVYIRVYYSQLEDYELDLEVQWTNVDYDEANEWLCIYGGNMGSEDIQVDVWYGGAWQNLFSDLSSGWNNVSVSSYLVSSTFTIRFKGGVETGDTTQDSWDVDVTLLHLWSDEYTLEVEFTGSSNTEDWSQLNWTVNSAWTIGSVGVTLQLYNYTLDGYPTSGSGYIVYTSDDTSNTDENSSQTIDVNPTDFRNDTGYWKIKIKGVKATDTSFNLKVDWIEFKVKNVGTLFIFKNEGPLTAHIVSLWIDNSTHHQRYDINIFINSGDTESYTRQDISLPSKPYTVKVVTERGNMAVLKSQ